MALDVQHISLDISKQPTPQQVRLGQGDANATQLVVGVYDDGIAYSLDSYSVRLEMRLPNSDTYYSVDGTRSGNVATFSVDETYAATSYGFDGFGYVDILSGDTVICSTSRFQLVVLQNAQEGADPSTAYSNGIIEATERAIAAAEAAEGVVLQDVPTMSALIKGGAKLGAGLSVADDTLSLSGESYTSAEKSKLAGIEANANNYALPTMGASTKGGAKLGSGLEISNDVLSVDIEPSDIGAYTTAEVDSALANLQTAILQAQTLLDAIGTVPISNGGTGATTAAGAKAAIVDGQALAPASVAATGAVSGSSISDGTGTMAQLRATTSRFTFGNGYSVMFTDTGDGRLRLGFSASSSGQCNIMFNSSGLTVNYKAPGSSSSWKTATLATW